MPVTPQAGDNTVEGPFDEARKETGEIIHFITQEAERAWIAQKEALAIQKDRENRLTVLAQLKRNKTTEIQQALDVAKAMCPEGNPSNRFWLRVLSLQEENKALDKSISELMAAPRPASEKVTEYLEKYGHVTPGESVNEETSDEIPSTTCEVGSTEPVAMSTNDEPDFMGGNTSTTPHSNFEPSFLEDPMNVTMDHISQDGSTDEMGMSSDNGDNPMDKVTFEQEEKDLFLKTPAAAE